MRTSLLLLVLALGACGDDDGDSLPDGGATDGGSDAGGSEADGGPEADGGLGECPTPVPPFEAGVCDGMGMEACVRWANEHAGGTTAVCVPEDGRCARASECDAEGCRCGAEPECGAGAMCVSGFAGFGCVCVE